MGKRRLWVQRWVDLKKFTRVWVFPALFNESHVFVNYRKYSLFQALWQCRQGRLAGSGREKEEVLSLFLPDPARRWCRLSPAHFFDRLHWPRAWNRLQKISLSILNSWDCNTVISYLITLDTVLLLVGRHVKFSVEWHCMWEVSPWSAMVLMSAFCKGTLTPFLTFWITKIKSEFIAWFFKFPAITKSRICVPLEKKHLIK